MPRAYREGRVDGEEVTGVGANKVNRWVEVKRRGAGHMESLKQTDKGGRARRARKKKKIEGPPH